MWNATKKYQHGFSILEVMLVVTVVAIIFFAILTRISIWRTTYGEEQNLAQVQEFVAELMQGARAYYYSTCGTSPAPSTLTCSQLVSGGGITQQECDAMSKISPWGAGFSVKILEPVTIPPFYQLQVVGTFSSYPYDMAKLAATVNADAYAGGNQLTWTRLPSNTNVNQGVWYRVPGGLVAVTNATAVGGTKFDSGMWILNAGLAQFTAFQQKQGNVSGTTPACPD